MSNWKKVVGEKHHYERSQPHKRRRYGLLEKHKDYKIRSDDYHRKQDLIQKLKFKAALKNADEYYHSMHSSVLTNDGQHRDIKKGVKYTYEAKKVMKIQDQNYLTANLQHQKNAVDRIKNNLQFLNTTPNNYNANKRHRDNEDSDGKSHDDTNNDSKTQTSQHIVFVDSEADAENFSTSQYFNTPSSLVTRKYNRPTREQIQGSNIILNPSNDVAPSRLHAIEKSRIAAYADVEERLQRQEKIMSELKYIEEQRKLMTKGQRKKIVKRDKFGDIDESKTVYKWKLQRKR